MGATTFFTKSKGANAQVAFAAARERAAHDRGHGGYTGTIAEKDSYTMFTCPVSTDPVDHADALIEACHPKINNKWGPAGCIACGPGEYLFFGWASE